MAIYAGPGNLRRGISRGVGRGKKILSRTLRFFGNPKKYIRSREIGTLKDKTRRVMEGLERTIRMPDGTTYTMNPKEAKRFWTTLRTIPNKGSVAQFDKEFLRRMSPSDLKGLRESLLDVPSMRDIRELKRRVQSSTAKTARMRMKNFEQIKAKFPDKNDEEAMELAFRWLGNQPKVTVSVADRLAAAQKQRRAVRHRVIGSVQRQLNWNPMHRRKRYAGYLVEPLGVAVGVAGSAAAIPAVSNYVGNRRNRSLDSYYEYEKVEKRVQLHPRGNFKDQERKRRNMKLAAMILGGGTIGLLAGRKLMGGKRFRTQTTVQPPDPKTFQSKKDRLQYIKNRMGKIDRVRKILAVRDWEIEAGDIPVDVFLGSVAD